MRSTPIFSSSSSVPPANRAWFIAEQVEEEKNASLIVEQLERIGQSGGGLVHFNSQLGKRGEGK